MGAYVPLNQDGSQSEGFREKQDPSWLGIIPELLTHKEPFCACVKAPLSQMAENGDPLILYSNKVLSLFVLTITITLRSLQEAKLAIYSVSVVTSSSEGKQESDCKYLNWISTHLFSQEMQTGGYL